MIPIGKNPPGKFLQLVNAWLHKEPLSSIAHCLFWIFVLICGTPLACVFLVFQLIFRLMLWMTSSEKFDPRRVVDKELGVVITGCDSGFGKELAIVSAEAGFTVFAGVLREESFAQFRGITSIHPVLLDVTNSKSVSSFVESFEEWRRQKVEEQDRKMKLRVLHGLCNNAGVGEGGDIDWMDVESFRSIMEVNYFGLLLVTKEFLPILKQQAVSGTHLDSRVLNIVSMAGMSPPFVGSSAYSASKAAAYSLSTAMRLEFSSFKIKVVTVNPTFHGTPLVHSMREKVYKAYSRLPKSKQLEYGEEYVEGMKRLGADLPHSFTWNIEVVIDRLMNLLVSESRLLPGDAIIGTDGRFCVTSLRYLPTWSLDIFFRILNRPVPAVMRTKQ